nr:hypothetical protein [Saprospiraceae bacterium]
MKVYKFTSLLAALLLCTTLSYGQFDDLYDDVVIVETTSRSFDSDINSSDYDDESYNYDENAVDSEYYDDYTYSRRIRMFSTPSYRAFNPYRYNYYTTYDPFFDPYYSGFGGNTIVLNIGNSWGFNRWNNWGYNRWNNWGFNDFGYNSWGYNGWNYGWNNYGYGYNAGWGNNWGYNNGWGNGWGGNNGGWNSPGLGGNGSTTNPNGTYYGSRRHGSSSTPTNGIGPRETTTRFRGTTDGQSTDTRATD